MAGASSTSNPPRPRKRVEAGSSALKRARDGSAFTKCEACNSNVPVALIDMHSCSLDSKIKTNLEAQVIEKVTEMKKPASRKRAAASSNDKEQKPNKREKKSKNTNMPKRPPTAFFLFMADFRIEFKEANPDSKGVAEAGKAAGEKWKSMTDEEKKPYLEKAAELKAEYEKAKNVPEDENDDDENTNENQEEKEDAWKEKDEQVVEVAGEKGEKEEDLQVERGIGENGDEHEDDQGNPKLDDF